jgi:hypothetical protein
MKSDAGMSGSEATYPEGWGPDGFVVAPAQARALPGYS